MTEKQQEPIKEISEIADFSSHESFCFYHMIMYYDRLIYLCGPILC